MTVFFHTDKLWAWIIIEYLFIFIYLFWYSSPLDCTARHKMGAILRQKCEKVMTCHFRSRRDRVVFNLQSAVLCTGKCREGVDVSEHQEKKTPFKLINQTFLFYIYL